MSTRIAALFALGFTLAMPASVRAGPPDAAGRPWLVLDHAEKRHAALRAAAGEDADALLAALRFALDTGLFATAREDGAALLAREDTAARAATLLGFADRDESRVPAELLRGGEPALDVATFLRPPLAKAARQDALRDRFRDVRLANKSTYFDLWTDLPDDALVPWTRLLNGYYQTLRNRFRGWQPRGIDVLIFANRSDYLVYYLRRFQKTGEHVLGFYDPGRVLLVFFADASDPSEVETVARHECTHLLIDLSFRGAPLPPWLHEGMACYLAGDGAECRGTYNASLIAEFLRDAALQRRDRLAKLFETRNDKLVFSHYAWSWALVHFLSNGAHADAFQKFQVKLRDQVTPEAKPAQVAELARDLLLESLGLDADELEEELVGYFTREFALTRADQAIDFARTALAAAASAEDAARAREGIDLALAAIDQTAALPGADPVTIALTRLDAVSQRALRDEVPAPEARLAARALVTGLRSVASGGQDIARAALARRGLALLARAARIRPAKGTPFELRSALQAAADKATAASRDDLAALLPLHDDLLRLALEAQAAALDRNPLDRRALDERLFLAVEAAPRLLDDLFDALRLQAEVDPSDQHLGALATLYVALGRAPYAKWLMERARARSVGSAALAPYAPFFP